MSRFNFLEKKMQKNCMNQKGDSRRAFNRDVELHLENKNAKVEEGEVLVTSVIFVIYKGPQCRLSSDVYPQTDMRKICEIQNRIREFLQEPTAWTTSAGMYGTIVAKQITMAHMNEKF